MKFIKSKYFKLISLLILVFSSSFSLSITQVSLSQTNNENLSIKTSASGVSNYQITQSVTYSIEINISLTQTSGSTTYDFKYPRLNDRQPHSYLTEYTPPYQESELLYDAINVPSTYVKDEFNNTYDLFNASLSIGNNITLSQHYIVKENEVTFGDIEYLNIDMNDYNQSDPMFTLYGNNTMQYYETDNYTLYTASNAIAGSYSNPAMKAKKIIEFVSNYLTYDGNMPDQEEGAAWAYGHHRGDCSEYSTLAITLMRIQGIPARKVTGILTSEYLDFKPYVGYTRTFTNNDGSSNFLGHAWVEFYIPTVGWVACEPQSAILWKTSSYLRFAQNIGQWFEFPKPQPPGYDNISEFNYLFTSNGLFDDYDFAYSLKYSVINTNLNSGLDLITILIIVIVVSTIIVISIVILRYIIHKRRYASEW